VERGGVGGHLVAAYRIPLFCRFIAWLPRRPAATMIGMESKLSRQARRFAVLVLLALTALVATPAGAGAALVPNAFPSFCPDGAYCYTSAMLPLDGAGLNAHAYIYFHNHDDHSYTIDGVRVVNSPSSQTCSMDWALTNKPGGPAIWYPDHVQGTYPCVAGVVENAVSFGLVHGVAGQDGVVEVRVFTTREGTSGEYTYHSLSTNDFNPGAHTCAQTVPHAKPNLPRCGDF
jgi:hypothetical protein